MSRERMWRTEVEVTETMRDGDRCVLVVTGDLDMDSVPVLARSLSVALRDVGRVIVDVSRLGVAWAPALQVFPSALALMGGWPQARMVLCGADDGLLELLHELRVADEVPVVCDEDAARERLLQPPTRIVRCYDLCPEPGSLRRARELVRVACRDWGAGEVADDAVVVASELVGYGGRSPIRRAGQVAPPALSTRCVGVAALSSVAVCGRAGDLPGRSRW